MFYNFFSGTGQEQSEDEFPPYSIAKEIYEKKQKEKQEKQKEKEEQELNDMISSEKFDIIKKKIKSDIYSGCLLGELNEDTNYCKPLRLLTKNLIFHNVFTMKEKSGIRLPYTFIKWHYSNLKCNDCEK